jgi:hypothetical protein
VAKFINHMSVLIDTGLLPSPSSFDSTKTRILGIREVGLPGSCGDGGGRRWDGEAQWWW